MTVALNSIESFIETFPKDFWRTDKRTMSSESSLIGCYQILTVDIAACFSSNYRMSHSDRPPRANSTVHLSGQPSPGSDVTNGHIMFVPEEELQLPRYVQSEKRIDLWMRDEMLPMVMQQMGHEHRYLWIGWFPDGHIYGDLHSV